MCDDHAKRHDASATHLRRGGEEEVKEKVELVTNEVVGTDEGSSGNGWDKKYVEEDSDYGYGVCSRGSGRSTVVSVS